MGPTERPTRALGWAWPLLVACHGAPAPAQTRPPPAPVVVAPAPGSAPAPAPVPAPEPPPALTWDELRDELLELQAYAPIALAEPPTWLAAGSVLWVRLGKSCRPITMRPEDAGRGELEVCTAKLPDADVVCTRTIAVGPRLGTNDGLNCSATFPNGHGMGSMSGANETGPGRSLVAADGDRLRYTPTWTLAVEAERLVWVRGECTPASLTTLTRALAAEGLTDVALRDALYERHGVMGEARRCLEYHGVRVHARPADAKSFGDRGAEARDASGPQDCTISCPDTAGELRRRNAVLRDRTFVRTDDTASITVHRTRAACDADPTGGLPAVAGRPCRDWLSDTARARRKKP